MTKPAKIFHEAVGVYYHGAALLYAVLAYALGIYGLFLSVWWVNAGAVLLLAHGMVIGAYLIHECGHNTVFRSNENNAKLGTFLTWMTGCSYSKFEDIRYKHFRHHMDNDDSVWFVYDDFWDKYPLVAKIVQFFEWFYIPAHDILMHVILVFQAFIIPERRSQRWRNALVILVRGGIFFSALFFFPKVALLYLLAYMLMMLVLRFMDSLQHDYGANLILFDKEAPSRFGGRKTEQAHTFSVPLSLKYDWINWLTLNFGFHNAHHHRPTVPWYRLPAYHRDKLQYDDSRVIPFKTQLKIFHKYRVQRVLHAGGDIDGRPEVMQDEYLKATQAGEVYGGNAVSFLVSF